VNAVQDVQGAGAPLLGRPCELLALLLTSSLGDGAWDERSSGRAVDGRNPAPVDG